MWHEEICEKKHDFNALRSTEEHEGQAIKHFVKELLPGKLHTSVPWQPLGAETRWPNQRTGRVELIISVLQYLCQDLI
jgi:hypothetical protein